MAVESSVKVLDSCLPVQPFIMEMRVILFLQVEDQSCLLIIITFPCILASKTHHFPQIPACKDMIVRDCPYMRGPESVFIRIIHFYCFGIFCSFVKAYSSKMTPLTPHVVAPLFLSLSSSSFSVYCLPICTV